MKRIELPVGTDTWAFTVRPEALLRPVPTPRPPANPRTLMRDALAAPLGLGVPLHRAFTPDDRVAIVIDPRLPQLGELIAGVLEHLAETRIEPGAVTLLAPPGSSDAWLMDLPDEFSEATLETHDPADRKRLAYVSTTKGGRRLYMNRTLVDADAMIVLSGRGFDPRLGYAGAEAALFPAFSDTETRSELDGTFNPAPPDPIPNSTRTEASEVAWLLGTPLMIQVIEGPGDTIAEIVAGLPDSTSEGIRRQNARWRIDMTDRADLVLAAVAGSTDRTDFTRIAAAAACGTRVLKPGGRVVVLTTAAPTLPDAVEFLRSAGNPISAAKLLLKEPLDDATGALLWLFAAQSQGLSVASGWPADVVTELFATPVNSVAEVQAMLDNAERILIVPDADKTMLCGT